MARRHKPEEIIGKLREAEIVMAQRRRLADACRQIGVTEQLLPRAQGTLRPEDGSGPADV